MSEKLADELFRLVEADQGKAYISDGIGNLPDEEIFDIARQTIALNIRQNRKLRAWLKRHGEPVRKSGATTGAVAPG